MSTPLKRIRNGASLLGVIILISVFGYWYWGKYSLVESVWMTTITLSSVGYGERPADDTTPFMMIFTCFIIVVGMIAVGYTIGGFLQMLAQGEIDKALGIHRLNKEINQLRRHTIICGFGRMGQVLAENLKCEGHPFVIVESDQQQYDRARSEGFLALLGDATSDEILMRAGILKASTMVCGLPSDTSNVFITLTSRGLNPELQIIARAEKQSSEIKMLQAGADRTVLPATIGAHQMSRMITRPNTADLVHLVSQQEELSVELDEYKIQTGNRLVGVSVRESRARNYDLLIIAVNNADQQMTFNPKAEYRFEDGDTIILMGDKNNIQKFASDSGFA